MVEGKKVIYKKNNTELWDYGDSFMIFGLPYEDKDIFNSFTYGTRYTKIDNSVLKNTDPRFGGYMTAKSNADNLRIIDSYFGEDWRTDLFIPKPFVKGESKYQRKENVNENNFQQRPKQSSNRSNVNIVKNDVIKPIQSFATKFVTLADELNAMDKVQTFKVNEDEIIIAGPTKDIEIELENYEDYNIKGSFDLDDKQILYIDLN